MQQQQQQQQQKGEEEQESLVFATAKVVEYLEPLMSRDLLCKFPDNSAFDFDYTQSSIWSPLLHRAANADFDFDSVTPTKLAFEFGSGFGLELEKKCNSRSAKKFRPYNLKKKIATAAFNSTLNLFKNKNKNKKRKRMSSDFSPTPVNGGCAPIITKVQINYFFIFIFYMLSSLKFSLFFSFNNHFAL